MYPTYTWSYESQYTSVLISSIFYKNNASSLTTLTLDAIKLDEALKLLSLVRVLGTNFAGEEISGQKGRYGSYLKSARTNLEDTAPSLTKNAVKKAASKKNEVKKATCVVIYQDMKQLLESGCINLIYF